MCLSHYTTVAAAVMSCILQQVITTLSVYTALLVSGGSVCMPVQYPVLVPDTSSPMHHFFPVLK